MILVGLIEERGSMDNQHHRPYFSIESHLDDCKLPRTAADHHLSAITLLQQQIAHEEAELKKLLKKHGVDILSV